MQNSSFYNSLSNDYDAMINFSKNLKSKTNQLKKFTKNIEKAADIGCGTGIDSIALALNNVQVDGFDPSNGMTNIAEKNAKEQNVEINFYNHSIDEIPKSFENKFDLIISLGNAIANIPQYELEKGLLNVFNMLNPKGKFLIQILNYKKLLLEKERIINIRETNGKFFIRFYNYEERTITFNIISFDKNSPNENEIISTKLYPYRLEELEKILSEAGFRKVKHFGDLQLSEYDPLTSSNLVIEVTKN